MARIVDYQDLPSGGFLAVDENGQTTPTAYLPPAVKMGIDAQKQSGMAPPRFDVDPGMSASAIAPEPGPRLAYNDYGTLPEQRIVSDVPNPIDQGLHKAGQWIGDTWAGVKAKGDEIRAREAAKGNFSGIQNTDEASAAAAGVAPPGSGYGNGAPPVDAGQAGAQGPQIVPPEQRVQVGGQQMRQGLVASGAPMRIIPGGERKVGEAQTVTSYDPDAAANLKRGYQNQWEGTQKLGEAQKQENMGEANVLSTIPEGLRNLEANRQSAEEARQSAIDSDMSKLEQLRAESRQDVDPSRIWHNQDNGTKFWGALMVGLGELGAGMTGRPNVALGVINKAIDNDIDAQKSNIANKRAQFEDQRSLYKDNLAKFQDQRQAEIVTKAQYIEHAQAQLAALRAQAKTPEDEAKNDILSAELQKEAAKLDLDMTKVTHQIHTKVVPTQVVGGSSGPVMSPFDHERYVPQFGGLAPDKDSRALAIEKGTALRNIQQLAAENLRLRNNPQAFFPGTDANRDLASNQAQLILETKKKGSADLGVIAGPDMDLMLDALGKSTSPMPGQSAALQNFVANQKRMNENARQNLGIVPVEVSPYVDSKTGETKMGQRITGNVITPSNVSGQVEGPIPTQQSYGGGGGGKRHKSEED
jgi:hypothetical protein